MATPDSYTPTPERDVDGVKPYTGAAGGWGALGAVAQALRGQMAVGRDSRMLLKVNRL